MEFIRLLRQRSHIRLFLIFVLTFIVPLTILTFVFIHSYRTIYTQETQQAICREIDSVASTMDAQFQAAAAYASLIHRDSDLQDLLANASQ